MATRIFIYTRPKDQLEKNHNKEALVLIATKKSELLLEQLAIGTGFIPAKGFHRIAGRQQLTVVKSGTVTNEYVRELVHQGEELRRFSICIIDEHQRSKGVYKDKSSTLIN